jgi:hypothetical protein
MIWFGLHDLLLVRTRCSESDARFRFIFRHASDKALDERTSQLNTPVE